MNRRRGGQWGSQHSSDPPQLYESDSSELGSLVRAGRRRGPSDDAIRRMAGRLAASGALAAASTIAGSNGRNAGRYATYAFSAAVIIGLAGWVVTSRGASSASPSLAAPAETLSPVAASVPLPERDPVTAASSGEIPSIRIEALPSSKVVPPSPVGAMPKHSVLPTMRPPPEVHTPSSASEFALVQKARQALASDPARALSIAEEHAQTFPTGELVQEREVLAVEALVRLGRRNEAKARATALLDRFPNTPYVLRLAHSLGEPLAPAPSSATDR